jgi:hypothetical protein
MVQFKPPGYDLMTPTERVFYDERVSAGKDMSLSVKKRNNDRKTAARKLKRVIEKRMPATELATLESVKQTAVEHRQQQILYGVSLLSDKQKLGYDTYIAEAKHSETTEARKKICNRRAVEIAEYATKKHAEEDKRDAMTPEELQEYIESDGVVAKREKGAVSEKKYRDKRAAADVVRHIGMTTAEVEAERAKKAAGKKINNDRNHQIEKELRDSGDEIAINRRTARNADARAKFHLERAEHYEEITELFRNAGKKCTVFGEGVEREEAISKEVEKIMDNYAGVAHPVATATSKKWVVDHGDVSIRDKLAQGEWAAYLLITRTAIVPGKEEKCKETHVFLSEVRRNPLWRIEQEDGDLKRMSGKAAKSVIKSYILADACSAYDITSLEAACQFYLEDEIGMAHGLYLHKRAGSGNRLENSMTPAELKLFLSGVSYRYSLAISMIRVTDCVFAEIDMKHVERPPPLISASVSANDGTGTLYKIRVGPFPDTPSVVADKASVKASYAATNSRHRERKRKAEELTVEADGSEGGERKR